MAEHSLDILMIFPSGGNISISSFKNNLGSAYIIAYLRKNGFRANQFLSYESHNVKECVKKIIKSNPKVVGFTVYDSNYMQCVLISKSLKVEKPNLNIIFGGPTATVSSKEILESCKDVDLCVRGEGEETVLELLNILSENSYNLKRCDLANVKGITFRKEDKINFNSDRNALLSDRFSNNNLDKYPSPYLSKVIDPLDAHQIGIITTRGCNQNCVYCNCAVLSKKNIFFHSIERVIEELIYLNDNIQHKRPIPINDDNFTLLQSRTKQICEAIIENDLKLPLFCITRCDKITEELLDLMKQAGFVSVGFSLESAVPRILRNIGKVNAPNNVLSENYDKEIAFIKKLKEMTSYAKKIGIESVYISIMVGLPGETIQDAQKTLDFVKQLDIDFYTHNNFHIFRGTPIYENYSKYGYIIKPIGQNNKILLQNNFPFDVYKIKLAPKSATEKNSRINDYHALKILSLETQRNIRKSFFDNIVIESNIIKSSLVDWIQDNLAINGTIIQLYSDKFNYLKNNKENLKTLYNQFLPTMYYEDYFWENNKSILRSGRTINLGEQIGMNLKFKDTYSTMEQYKEENIGLPDIISTESKITDTEALYDLLIRLFKSNNSFQYLLKSKLLPQFQNLCRWTKNHANCMTLETAIVGKDDSVRICWNSEPLGKIGISFSEIIRVLNERNKIERIKRKCDKCIERDACVKCLYPFPLNSQEYCKKRKAFNTIHPAKLISKFTILKDLIFKPTMFHDF
ncbi:MAG: B12-binding domain-containing radical SAM protein [Candidatus Thorarchaeota archaeon]